MRYVPPLTNLHRTILERARKVDAPPRSECVPMIFYAEELEERIPSWKTQGLSRKSLSPYAPELNLIKILGRRITYYQLPFSAYQCLNALIEA